MSIVRRTRLAAPLIALAALCLAPSSPAAAQPTCTTTDTALCVSGGRFRVTATWETAQDSGVAHVEQLTNDTGYLWFFTSTNVEAVIKVLNGCGLNERYWVFAGGLTDVEAVIKVEDLATATVKNYTNPQGTPFQPIQDTSAFATCP